MHLYPWARAQAHSVAGVTLGSAQVASTMAMAVGPHPEPPTVALSPLTA